MRDINDLLNTKKIINRFEIPDTIAYARKHDQLKHMSDPKILNQVYEEQNGTCKSPDCNQSISIIARAHGIMGQGFKYFGFCDSHAQPYLKKESFLHKKT